MKAPRRRPDPVPPPRPRPRPLIPCRQNAWVIFVRCAFGGLLLELAILGAFIAYGLTR